MDATDTPQRLHLVMGGRVKDPQTMEFRDPESIHVVGVFSDYDSAVEAWRANAQRTVDELGAKPDQHEPPERVGQFHGDCIRGGGRSRRVVAGSVKPAMVSVAVQACGAGRPRTPGP